MKLILLLTLVVFASAKPSTRCPSVCKCIKYLEAECTSLDIKQPFGLLINTLTITNPKEHLNLNANTFKNLGLENLSKLFIENATISKIDSKTFEGLPLTHLFIRNSFIAELPVDVFEPLTNLNIIDFSKSNLKNFSEIRSKYVEEIKLSSCNLREIPETMFKHCPELAYLNLEHNNLKHFKPSKYNTGLFEINLSNNKLSEFDLKDLNNLTENFVTLILSHNPNLKLKNYQESNNILEKLVLKGCNIKNADFLEAFTVLTELDLSDNQISKLNENALAKMVQLEKIDLSNNELEALADNIFAENTRLDRIILDKNKFKTLPKFTTKDFELRMEYFSCKKCGLMVLDPKTFEKASSLRTLILSNNQLESISADFFRDIRSLQEIDLSHNHLKQLNNDLFINNPDITKVTLAGNPLKQINSKLFRKNYELHYLDVSNCELENLWMTEQNVSMPNSLRTVIAENNKIQIVTKDLLKHAKNLDVIQLNGNPLKCVRTLKDTITYLKNKYENEQFEQTYSWLTVCDDDFNYYADDYYYSNREGDEDEEETDDDNDSSDNIDDKYHLQTFTDTYTNDEDEQFLSDAEDVLAVEGVRFGKTRSHGEIIVFLLPTLVFVLTALIVLIITVVSILFILHKKKLRNSTNSNLPKINIIPWGSSKIIKKHSGSVYRPLSEEKIPEMQ